jgi:hypothetical protein
MPDDTKGLKDGKSLMESKQAKKEESWRNAALL